MKKDLPFIEVTDEGVNGWGWECPYCWKSMIEEDPVAEGDILVCEGCGKEYRVS